MNILHLLSQNHLTGAEVYAAQLIHDQVDAQNNVFQISNGFFAQTKAQQQKLDVEAKSFFKFLKNVFWLRQFLIENNIQVIHTHSRAAAKLAFWARFNLKIGMVSTVHGRQHPSFSKKLFNQYGDFLIAVCETIHFQLRHSFGYDERKLLVVRNPISATKFTFSEKKAIPSAKKIKIAIIGRTTGPKGRRTEQILNALPLLLQKLNVEAEYYLAGGSRADLSLTSVLEITERNVTSLSSNDYLEFDLIFGSGRVAMESLITGVPTISFGEAKYIGLARFSNLKENYVTNFGDIDPKTATPALNVKQLEIDLNTFISGDLKVSELKQISDFIQKDFNPDKISKRIMRIYESSYFLRNYSKWIPILMYHKVPKTEIQSQHKIFVTTENFKSHLQFFKKRGFQTLTFSDLKKFKSGKTDFATFPKKPLMLTFDDGYKDNLENASPLLKEFGFKAQLFLLADQAINSNRWDHSETEQPHEIVSGTDRQKWKDSAFEIGSHGLRHQKITQMTEAEARLELSQSKKNLENEFGTEIPVYAFTYGDTNSKASEWSFEEGYDYAVNTDSGGLILEEDPHKIFRVNIFPNETKISLFKKTSSWYRSYYLRKRKK